MKKILFVDDEEQILVSIVRLFRTTQYEVFTASDGEKALDILKIEKMDIIISDMRMPFMDGYELLSKVKELYPKIIRVVLSGYADEKLIFNAIQKNIAKLFIIKPWDNEELLNVVKQIFETENAINNSNLLMHINNIEELPTINANYQRIISLIQNDADIDDITHEIEKDQAIALKVLHIANSAYYGIRTGSVKQAVSYLGFQNINNLIVSTSIIDTLNNSGVSKTNCDVLWKHAFVTNKIVNFIFSRFLSKKLSELSNTAGLLHDVGKIFLYKCFGEKYESLDRKSKKEDLDIFELEKVILGITHEEAGGYLLKWWELPHSIVEAAFFHHRPTDERVIDKELVCAVHIADKYSWDIINGKYSHCFNEEAFTYLKIDRIKFEEELKKLIIDV
ncbi:MAG TPA: response regulator [Clostridiales bacterium]|nr:MAG: signal transduction protein [Clostridiales bacterium GWD2_32_19]HCC08154.1 response regulator [Clostridiales bacterium]